MRPPQTGVLEQPVRYHQEPLKSSKEQNMDEFIKEMLQGAVDFHLHASPDPYRERSADAIEVAQQSKALGMKGFVLKSHTIPTAPLAQVIKKFVTGIEIIGGLALNRETGGLNPYAVEVSAKLGAKILWMPTLASLAVRQNKGFQDGIAVMGTDHRIVPEMKEILSLAGECDLVVCTGHLVQDEIIALFAEAKRMKVGKFVLTHPMRVAGTAVDLKVQKELAEQGAFIEHCFLSTTQVARRIDPAIVVEAIRFVGAEHCLLSTDFGKVGLPPPWEGMKEMLSTMSHHGLTREELILMVKDNPSRLLGI
jgi:hypothetical protein